MENYQSIHPADCVNLYGNSVIFTEPQYLSITGESIEYGKIL
jgi:hypothetical protein